MSDNRAPDEDMELTAASVEDVAPDDDAAAADDAPKAPKRGIGVGGKLIAAFTAVAAITLVACGVAWFSFDAAENAFTEITEGNLPSIVAAQQLSESSGTFTAGLPLLYAARDEEQLARQADALNGHAEKMREAVERLEELNPGDPLLASVRTDVAAMSERLEPQRALIAERIARAADRAEKVAVVTESHEAITSTMTPLVQQAQLRMVSTGLDLNNSTEEAVQKLVGDAAGQLDAVLQIRADLSRSSSLLIQALSADSLARINIIDNMYQAVHERIAETRDRLEPGDLKEAFDGYMARFDAMTADGAEGNVFAVARRSAGSATPSSAWIAAEQEIAGVDAGLAGVLDKLAEEARAAMAEESNALVTGLTSSLDQVMRNDLRLFRSLLELSAESNLVAGLLNEAASTGDADRLAELEQRFIVTVSKILSLQTNLNGVDGFQKVQGALERLVGIGVGDNTLFELRQAELDIAARAEALLEENRALSEDMLAQVAAITATEQETTDTASESAKTVMETNRMTLLAIGGVSILIAALIGWLYVHRGLVRRLTGLSGAMRKVADGDLDLEIEAKGADEVTDMERALIVFRDTAREVEVAHARAEEERERASRERREARLTLANDFEASVMQVVDAVSTAASEMQATASSMQQTADRTNTVSQSAARASEAASSGVQTVAAAAEELAASIEEISRQVVRSTEIAGRAVTDAERTNGTVQGLASAAQKIGEVVKLITDIAEQTNL
ncbi:MAG TPA: HAMP domain-containing protein, partial [Alphaproteobacteria bacterium]|nr:HAMP domain-containing protein [Alphaproteobacteria bacterium]